MTAICVLGIDPGDTTGLFVARWEACELAEATAYQYPMDEAMHHVAQQVQQHIAAGCPLRCAQIEEWRRGRRAGRVHGTNPSLIEQQISRLTQLLMANGVPVKIRPAVETKTWATDTRLAAAGLLAVTTGNAARHSRDASRHALFTATHDCGLPDPRSRRYQEANS